MATLSIAAILAESAQRYPDRVAVVMDPQRITYDEMWREARLYATVLHDRGVRPGDRVGLLVPNVPDFPRFYYAVLSLGAVVVPVHALLTPEEIEYVLRDCGAALLCASGPLVEPGAKGAEMAGVPLLTSMLPEALPGVDRIEDLAARAEPVAGYLLVDPDADAVILYTSGTTGPAQGRRDVPLQPHDERPSHRIGGHQPADGGGGDPRLPAAVPHLRPDLRDERRLPRRRDAGPDAPLRRK